MDTKALRVEFKRYSKILFNYSENFGWTRYCVNNITAAIFSAFSLKWRHDLIAMHAPSFSELLLKKIGTLRKNRTRSASFHKPKKKTKFYDEDKMAALFFNKSRWMRKNPDCLIFQYFFNSSLHVGVEWVFYFSRLCMCKKKRREVWVHLRPPLSSSLRCRVVGDREKLPPVVVLWKMTPEKHNNLSVSLCLQRGLVCCLYKMLCSKSCAHACVCASSKQLCHSRDRWYDVDTAS